VSEYGVSKRSAFLLRKEKIIIINKKPPHICFSLGETFPCCSHRTLTRPSSWAAFAVTGPGVPALSPADPQLGGQPTGLPHHIINSRNNR